MERELELLHEIMHSRKLSARNYTRAGMRNFIYCDAIELTMAEIELLREISTAQEITPMELAAIMVRSKGAISQVLDKLHKKSLIESRDDAKDMRRKCYYLTETGKKVCAQDQERTQALYASILSGFEGIAVEDLENYLRINQYIRTGIAEFYNLR